MEHPPNPSVVLDTNVVLDWLVFRNADGQALFQAIEQGHIRWIATPAMRDELFHVLGRGVAAAWEPDLARIEACWQALAHPVNDPQPTGDVLRLRCTDPDDQKFIDLAACQAQWLISRDRAVLKLAGRAQRLGLRVVVPSRWQMLPS